MPHGGRREGAGRPRGSGNGPTVETHSVSLPPKTWQLIDEMRGSWSRGVFISVCVYRQISARLTTLTSGRRAKRATSKACHRIRFDDRKRRRLRGISWRGVALSQGSRQRAACSSPACTACGGKFAENIRLEPYGRELLCIADERKATAHPCRHDQGRSRMRDRG